MKIAILAYLDEEDGPADPVVAQVAAALRAGGHKPSALALRSDIKKLLAGLTRRKPEVVFNLMEMFGDNVLAEVGIAGLLDLLDLPFTGSGAGEFYLQQDKVLSKKLLAFHQIPYPNYAVFAPDATLETGGALRMPLFVKPLRADASIGIDGQSLVQTPTEMMKRVVDIHERLHDAALAEEYIEGREFYVGVLGNQTPVAFPPIELDFSKLPPDRPRIADAKAKWDAASAEFQGTQSRLAELTPELNAKLQKTAVDAYRALRVRDYGRVDLRVNSSNEIYVLEVNANCYLEQSSEFATAAQAAGYEYPALINKIVDLALERHAHGHSRISLESSQATTVG